MMRYCSKFSGGFVKFRSSSKLKNVRKAQGLEVKSEEKLQVLYLKFFEFYSAAPAVFDKATNFFFLV